MKILSWLGALVLFAAVAAATASVLRLPTETARVVTTTSAVEAAPYRTADAGDPARLLPAPVPAQHRKAKPAPVKTAAPRAISTPTLWRR